MSPEQIAYMITIIMCAVISYNKGLRQGATAMVAELTDTNILSKKNLEKFIKIKAEEVQ
jgi:hypothetical protein